MSNEHSPHTHTQIDTYHKWKSLQRQYAIITERQIFWHGIRGEGRERWTTVRYMYEKQKIWWLAKMHKTIMMSLERFSFIQRHRQQQQQIHNIIIHNRLNEMDERIYAVPDVGYFAHRTHCMSSEHTLFSVQCPHRCESLFFLFLIFVFNEFVFNLSAECV